MESHICSYCQIQNPGHLKISPGGILWKKQGGGKAVEVDRADILGVTWMKVPRTNQLSVLIKGGPWYKFTGFRDQVFLQCPCYLIFIVRSYLCICLDVQRVCIQFEWKSR